MSLINFICPDNGKIAVKQCLKPGGCRMKERCATRPYLMMCASERSQLFRCKNGHQHKFPSTNKNFQPTCHCYELLEYVPSTTQLIAGTKAAFLKLTTDYDVSPDSRAFMITGTKGHAALEAFEDEHSLIEEKFEEEDISGIADLLTIEDGESILSDYKVSGSYKVAKALGFETVDEGTGEFFKTGKRKGEEKIRKVVRRNEKSIDRFDWELQLNKYRINYENLGFKVDCMKIQCIVRDGNTYIARQRGVFRNVYYFDIQKLDDAYVLDYFAKKKADLLKALKQGFWEEVCDAKETWDGVKCASYCEVAVHCPLGKYLMREKEREETEMPIKGLTEARRLPRMGKIRLGIMAKSPKTGTEYPKEVKYFILDPSVANPEERQKLLDIWEKRYGKEPTSIDIMFPVADLEQIFPQYYKSYGATTLMKCKGDGCKAETNDPEYIKKLKNLGDGDFGKIVECAGRECPFYAAKQCSEVATLAVLLPELPGSGVWQVTTGSFHSILNLNSCFDYIRALAGRFHMIPLKLERREQEIAYEGKKSTHYVLHINLELALADLQRRAMIDPVKAAMELPPIADEAIDLYLEKNPTVNPKLLPPPAQVEEAQVVEEPNKIDANPKQAWDDEPWPEQANLALTIEAAIQEAETVEMLQSVKTRFADNFKKDSHVLTIKQREDLNILMRKRVADLQKNLKADNALL